ncbi:SRPBCC family protein [Undibacterium sp. TC4M20W]|uniref:SRPBCC family protein n=1 Tax=Undibacterium sp. TC4M20W TaxID=3413052 RepID=UPI003BF1D71D
MNENKPDFVITRILKAPRELVFTAFSEGDHLAKWWGPTGFTVVQSSMDLRVGGSYHLGMRGPDGSMMWAKFVYKEIIRPEKLVYHHSFSDEAGNLAHHPMSPAWPLEVLSTISFDEHAGGTQLTIRWALLDNATEEERNVFHDTFASMDQGFGALLDQLQAYLASL